jgi:anthranilate synthase component 2
MILIIDNYDSFTYNLVQYFGELGEDLKVYRNNKISIEKAESLKPRAIVISPGPGTPEDAGISCELVKAFKDKIPILGVCLGHQVIGYVFGAKIVRARHLMHGKTSMIHHKEKGIFQGLPNPFEATRYHSLIIDPKTLPFELECTAWTKDKEIMGLRHKKFPLCGVQFHPESIMTKPGMQLLKNFLKQ